MASVVLYTIHDPLATGMRTLGALLRDQGHDVALFFLGQDSFFDRPLQLPHDFLSSASPFRQTNMHVASYGIALPPDTPSMAPPEAFLNFLRRQQPKIVSYTGWPGTGRLVTHWFLQIKKASPDALLVAGGFEPTVSPELFLANGVDAVIRGEGEHAFCDLAKAVSRNDSWRGIANISYQADGVVTHNPLRPFIRDLDALPFPLFGGPGIFRAKEDVLLEEDPCETQKDVLGWIFTGRGCIGQCSYCLATGWREQYRRQSLKAPRYRHRSTRHVIAELAERKKKGARRIVFEDDFFVRPHDEAAHFFQEYKEKVTLPFEGNFPPKMFLHHPDLLEAALDAGLAGANIDIQSADEEYALRYFSRRNNNQDILALTRRLVDLKLTTATDFIEGLPWEKEKNLEKNLAFIKQLPPFNPAFPEQVSIRVHYLRLYPGAPILHQWPDISSEILPPREFLYRAMLLICRHTMTDEEFWHLRENQYYRKKPELLVGLHYSHRRAKHEAYIMRQAQALLGKEVYFFGCGEIFHRRKHLFWGVKPLAILADYPVHIREIDGIPILAPGEWLRDRPDIPIVIFSNQALKITRALGRLTPDFKNQRIIPCQTC